MLIKNGLIVNSDKSFKADIYIKDGKINEISQHINIADAEIIDADGKLVFPGGIDPHVHMDLPTPAGKSSDDFYTGSQAALAGGTTSIIDFVTPERGESYLAALAKRKKEAEKSIINTYFHMSPTWWGENTADEIHKCINEHGINSFKVYLAYKSGIGINDDVLLKVMQVVAKEGALLTLHCEHGETIDFLRQKFISEGKTSPMYHPLSRPNETEAEAVGRAIMMSKYTNCPIYIVHVSTAEAIELIEKAQCEGQKVYAETCPQYLLLDDSVYNQEFEQSAKYVLSPPIRKVKDQIALWQAMKQGVVQTIGTDHCPFNLKGQKDLGINDFTKIANGAGGVEHRLALLYTFGVLQNKISINQFVDLVSTKPAEIFKLKNKGKIELGYDADIVIWKPSNKSVISAKTHKQNCDSNIFEGFKTKGSPENIILKGKSVN